MSRLMMIKEFADRLGISEPTLRRMHKEGRLVPEYVSPAGYRYYSEEQIYTFSKHPNRARERKVIGYCRVSTPAQKDDLAKQVDNVRMYMLAKGYSFEIIEDVGSGINYKNKGLQKLIEEVCKGNVSKVVTLYRDRLTRFGFDLVEKVCAMHGCEIEIIDTTERTREQELCDDLIQIVTVFANRLYGARSKKTKKLIEDVKKDACCNKDTDNPDA